MELLLLYRNSCPRCDKSLRDSMFELKYLKKERGIFLIERYILLELLTIIFYRREYSSHPVHSQERDSCNTFRSMIFPPSLVFFNFEKTKC